MQYTWNDISIMNGKMIYRLVMAAFLLWLIHSKQVR